MKNLFYTLSTVAIASLIAVGCTKSAEANNNVSVLLGYQNNNVISEDGAVLDVSTLTSNNIKLGLNTFTQVQDGRLLTYGAYVGYPVTLQNTKLTVTPSLGVDRYRTGAESNDNSDTDNKGTVGNVALNFDYQFDTTTYATIQTKYSDSFKSEEDLDGGSYTFGVTKLFN